MGSLVSVVTCALNQADWVRKTVPKIKASLGDTPYEIIVVNDQTEDDCCERLDEDVRIIKTPTRFGVSKSRRLGVSYASGDTLLFTDPHCDYPGTALQDLVGLARSREIICLPKTRTLPISRRTRFGGRLGFCDRGLKITHSYGATSKYPALLGSIYCVQRRVYDILGGWPELPGVWGYSEQALSLMAWFAGVDIVVDERHVCNHEHYHPHNRFSYSVTLSDQANNGHWIFAGFFPETYEEFWAPILKKRFPRKERYWSSLTRTDKDRKGRTFKLIDRFRSEIKARAIRTEKDFFTLVLEKEYPACIPLAKPLSTSSANAASQA
jgi:glycosyltransferase involved in cell wall biosynthesis